MTCCHCCGDIPAIGASGAVWGVVALYALMYPYERIYIYFLFPIEIRWLVLLYFIFDLHPVLLALSGDRQFTGVAHAAHIGGGKSNNEPPKADENTGDRLDTILNKVSRHGRDALTDDERAYLEEASRKMREQRR